MFYSSNEVPSWPDNLDDARKRTMEINKEHEYRIRKVITIKINKDLLQAGLRKIKTYYQNFIHVHDFQLHLKFKIFS